MADHAAQAVVKAVVAAAKDGDMTAARLVLDRIAPPCRGRPVRLNLPPIWCGRWPRGSRKLAHATRPHREGGRLTDYKRA
jgi:hypothetical protein